jgi:ATP-dependent Lhr-like helicase
MERLLPPQLNKASDANGEPGPRDPRELAVLHHLEARGASFFGPLHEAVGGGYPAETVTALWNLVWQGLVTNDTFHALRAFTRARLRLRRRVRAGAAAFRSRRQAPTSAEGRWSLVAGQVARTGRPTTVHATKWAAALAQQLLARQGIVTRESVAIENIVGGFSSVYPVLKAMEESGRLRRGYFVAGLGATQFALPGAVDLLRTLRETPEDTEVALLAATDPASPYGATLKWPAPAAGVAGQAGRGPTRTAGATVVLVNGALAGYLARGDRQLLVFLPEREPERSKTGRAVAQALNDRARALGPDDSPRGMSIEEIDGVAATLHPLGPYLIDAGFKAGASGFQPDFRS